MSTITCKKCGEEIEISTALHWQLQGRIGPASMPKIKGFELLEQVKIIS